MEFFENQKKKLATKPMFELCFRFLPVNTILLAFLDLFYYDSPIHFARHQKFVLTEQNCVPTFIWTNLALAEKNFLPFQVLGTVQTAIDTAKNFFGREQDRLDG
ncbi:hypothetical protein BpHYR1_013604, partial [Brachionus plicatilis]